MSCGCKINDEFKNYKGIRGFISTIVQCPLHLHAKELLEALKKAHDCIETEFGDCHTWGKNLEECKLCALIKKCEEK